MAWMWTSTGPHTMTSTGADINTTCQQAFLHDSHSSSADNAWADLQAQPSREVLHAISVCEAMQADDHRTCFKLYASAPRMGRALMDIAYPNLRFDALRMLCEGFRPTLPVPHAARLLGFVAGSIEPDVQEQHQEIPPGSSQPRFPGKHAAEVRFQSVFLLLSPSNVEQHTMRFCGTLACTLLLLWLSKSHSAALDVHLSFLPDILCLFTLHDSHTSVKCMTDLCRELARGVFMFRPVSLLFASKK